MKLQGIRIEQPLVLDRLPGKLGHKYKHLTADFSARFVTDEGVWRLRLLSGWITDERSGSDTINWLVPKRGNDWYNATILMHDCAWSGWMSRALSNELLRQGMILSGEVGPHAAALAKLAVDRFGRYYDLEEELPPPYHNNRLYESLTMESK